MERRKGIRSLIPDGTLAQRETEGVQEVPVEMLAPSPFQPRVQMEEEELEGLVESVRAHGILQPLVARRRLGKLELIAGERRLEAARRAGLERVPVVVREATDREMLELALVENLQREDINPMEEAGAYHRLIQEFGLTQEQVAERVGKSRSSVANSLRLLQLPREIQESLRRGEIEAGHGKILAGLEVPREALRIWRKVVKRGLSVRATAREAAKLTRSVPRGTFLGEPKTRPTLDPNLEDLQQRLRMKLQTQVKIRPTGRGGVIEVPYVDEHDLERVCYNILR